MMELRNKRVLVVGLARTGRAVAQRLSREGAVVTVTDLRPPASFDFALKELAAQKIGLELGLHRPETFLSQDLIVVSPGVPWDMPQLDAARKHKIQVVPEVEAASWFFQGTLVGITGTNGKTTTTTLLGKMLEGSGFQTYVAGNIGVPLISAVDLYSPESIVVAELSSFQLEAIQNFRPQIAVLLNLTANHLDRHRTFEAYVSAKAQIFRNQQPDDYAILNADDPVVMSLEQAIASQKVFFSMEHDLPEGVLLSGGRILYRVGHLERDLFEEREIKLRGKFNVQNVMAAAAAACTLGADFKAIRSVVREFAGVEHRLEYVTAIRGVAFYNDSKATSVDAAAKALSTFDRGVHLILGGTDKGAPYTSLRPLIEEKVKSVYLIGAAAQKIAADLAGADLHQAGDLKTAVRMAFQRAIAGDSVLLSPACSSYDQFHDFEERGRIFKEAVEHLANTPVTEIIRPVATYRKPEEARKTEPQAETVKTPPPDVAAPDYGVSPPRPEPSDDGEPLAISLSAPSETSGPAPPEPVYVYEVGSEDTPLADQNVIEQDVTGEQAANSEGAIIEEDAPVLPYEVPAAGGDKGGQQSLFERERTEKSKKRE
ncbi:MAG: UDP-N-acetylmuramoyl-L-alanine--D-glutamate ligase [Terriglobia bacterium]